MIIKSTNHFLEVIVHADVLTEVNNEVNTFGLIKEGD
jgi:hypothetical protein